MSKEITKAYILQQLQDKFKLREFEATKFLFDETVVPVYNVEQHLEHWKCVFKEIGITTSGVHVFFVVPENEKWHLWRYDVVFMGAGAYTVAGVYTRRAADEATNFCYLDLGAAITESYHVALPIPVILESGDKIAINVDGYTSPQDLRLYIDYMVEEIR